MAAVESTFRVFHFSPQLVESFRKARDQQEIVTRAFVVDACDNHLSRIVKELRAVGLSAIGERRAVRLEVPLSALADLAGASEQTGVPATTLLSICLSRASTARKRKSR